MKNILFTTFVILFSVSISKAQTVPPFQWGISLDSTINGYGGTTLAKNGGYLQSFSFSGNSDFDPGSGIFSKSSRILSPGMYDHLMLKLDQNRDLEWSLQFDTLVERASIMNYRQSNDYLIMGNFSGNVDFDPGSGTSFLNANDGGTFLVRLDSNRNFIWAKQYDGSTNKIIIDEFDQIFIGGIFNGVGDFDPGPGTFFFSNINNPVNIKGGYVLKLDANANLIWGKHFENTQQCGDVELGLNKDIFISGILFDSADLDPGPSTDYKFNASANNHNGLGPFFAKLDSNGNYIWSKNIYTHTNDSYNHYIELDNADNIYIAGTFNDTCDFDPGPGISQMIAVNPNNYNNNESYLAKLDLNGNFIWAKQFSSTSIPAPNTGQVFSFAMDQSNNLYITGWSDTSVDFDPGPGTAILGGQDYITKYNSNGDYIWGFTFGTSFATGINVINDDNVIVNGLAYGTVDTDPGAVVRNIFSGTNGSLMPFAVRLQNLSIGIQENLLQRKQVALFPNPANESIFIATNEKILHASCYNLSGQKIKVNRTGKQLDIEHLAPGNYFLEIGTSKGYYTGKFSKQ